MDIKQVIVEKRRGEQIFGVLEINVHKSVARVAISWRNASGNPEYNHGSFAIRQLGKKSSLGIKWFGLMGLGKKIDILCKASSCDNPTKNDETYIKLALRAIVHRPDCKPLFAKEINLIGQENDYRATIEL